MAEAPYLMGIDLGTGGVRVGLFDREGSPVAFRAEEWETRHPHPGWAEQDPGEWWTGLVRATRGALEERGLPAAEVAGISVDATASTVEGLLVLDYFQGNRSPYTDPHARGLISGLSLRHGTGHLFRAILEGICYGTELIFATLRRHDFELRSIVAAGGATRSELWMQLHADVSDVPIPTSPRPPPRWSTSSAPSTPTRAGTSSMPSSWTATPSCIRR